MSWDQVVSRRRTSAFLEEEGMKTLVLLFAMTCFVSGTAAAQVDAVTTPPPNLVVPNYSTVPVGPFGGLETTAYAARVDDPSAAWFNPAGLGRQISPQISGSAGVYSHTSVTPLSLQSQGGSIQQLPNFVGFTVKLHKGMTVGAALLTSNAWNQETDSERVLAVANGQERFAYSADSEFTRRVAAVSAGYRGKDGWRMGGGFAFSLTDLRLVQGTSDRIADGTGVQTLLVTSHAEESALQLRGQAGVQYDTGPWQFGGAIRTPGVNLHKSGTVTLEGVLSGHTGSLGASLFDADATAAYHLPWEFQGGAAIVHQQFEVEIDVEGYSPISTYALVSSGQPTVTYNDAGTGTPPTILTRPFGGLTTESDGVVNVSVGGHYKPLKDRDLRIHAGVATSKSPVGAADAVFSKVDLLSWTVGASGALGKFQFSVGVNLQRGTTDDITLRNLLNGETVTTRADVRMNGLVYQLAYQF
jgi:hypothetical protein